MYTHILHIYICIYIYSVTMVASTNTPYNDIKKVVENASISCLNKIMNWTVQGKIERMELSCSSVL